MSTFKELPDGDKPYEKCLKYGPGVLSDTELLAVFIRTGTRDSSPIDIARQIMLRSGKNSIVGLANMRMKDYLQIEGIGEVKAILLACLVELSKRIARQNAVTQISMSNSKSIANYYMEQLRHEKQEQVWVCVFDTKCNLISDRMVTMGTINSALISPREVYKYALSENGAFIVVIHNHPSGDPTPSENDIEATYNLKKAGDIIGIKLLDHIIIGDRVYTSLADAGLFNEEEA
ncbi:MAG: DNA repair protein RadC [Lachnospiraceae bacterium]|nr:DNA repair protein RadC [Lachnospiraceae bacterium]